MRKLAVIAATGIGLGIVCIGAAAVIEAPHWSQKDWDNLDISFNGLDACKPAPGATATTVQLEWTGGDEIAIAVPGQVHYTQGVGTSITASGDPDTIAHLRVRHHTLELNCHTGFHDRKLDVTLPGRPFRSFTVAGSGTLDLNQLDQPSLDLIVAGSGRIKASGKADAISFNIAGSGTIEASGQADSIKLVIAGSGDAKLGQLVTKIADVNIAGSGDAEIAPQDEARIKIAGSGDVHLLSEPKTIDTRIFGSGRILHGAH